MVDKLEIHDPRVTWHTATVLQKQYHYMRADPENEPLAIIFLLHGFPDLAFGWRYQIPCLQSHGYQVIAPDMLGFGQTHASSQLSLYGLRSIAEDVRDLADLVAKNKKIILGGHGWGAALAWRTALWFPDLVQGIFSIGTPFSPPSSIYRSLDDIMRNEDMENLRYQLQFQGSQIDDVMTSETTVRQFLNAMFGGKSSEGEIGFEASRGIVFRNLTKLNRSHLLSHAELEYYVSRYFENGKSKVEGPLRWYRTQAQNYLDELRLLLKPVKFSIPALYLAVTHDKPPPTKVAEEMYQYFEKLTCKEIDGSRWIMWEAPAVVNEEVVMWLKTMVV